MSDEREFYYLQEQDAAAADWDIDPTPPAYPEWNRRRVEAGQPVGTFTEYLSSIGGFIADALERIVAALHSKDGMNVADNLDSIARSLS